MKRIIASFFILSLVVLPGMFPSPAKADDIITPLDSDTLHFVIKVRWGNVLDEVTDSSSANFDGSISVSSNSKITMFQPLKIEDHDEITSKDGPITWTSLIYGHWDGIKALVTSPATDSIVITTTQGSVTKTAKELYIAEEEIVQDVGNGKEIVIKVVPIKSHAFNMKLLWGMLEREKYSEAIDCESDDATLSGAKKIDCRRHALENFSGSLNISDGAEMKLIRTVRFDTGDSVTVDTSTNISWTSSIRGGVDGMMVKFVMDRDVDLNKEVTLSFSNQSYIKSISLIDLFHKRVIKDQVSSDYSIIASKWSFSDRKLVRADGDPKVYLIEDGTKRHIPNPEVFNDQSLDWTDVEDVHPDELLVLAEDDPLSYTEGTLIKGEGPEVYAISNDQKRHVTDPNAFNRLQYNWNHIVEVDNSELNLYSTGEEIDNNSDYPDSTLVQVEGEPTVHVVEGDKLKPITSPAAFESNNYRWERIKKISKEIKNKYKTGESVQLGNGALVKDPNGKIYKINEGKKQWIRTVDDFFKGGFKEKDIIDVNGEEIKSVEEGEDIVADDTK